MLVKQLISKKEKPQEELFTEDHLTAASNKRQVNNYDIVKSSSGKMSFKSSMCVIILYGPFSLIFILIKPLTAKKENIACLFHCFYIDSTNPLEGTQTLIYVELCPVR